jgi:hypothetical protein
LAYLRPVSIAGGATSAEFVALYDRVGVTKTNFSGSNTKLLFHVLNDPTIIGGSTNVSPGETLYTNSEYVTASAGNGTLFMRVLAPAAHNLRKVGGSAQKAFWVFGYNVDYQWSSGEAYPRPINGYEGPYGQWRIELEPADNALDHNFLTVLQPAHSSVTAMSATAYITGTGVEGALMSDPIVDRVVLFSSAWDGASPVGVMIYSYASTGLTWSTIFDLQPKARYRALAERVGASVTVSLIPDAAGSYRTSDQGVLSIQDTDFDALPDAWEISMGLNPMDATGVNGASGDKDSDGCDNFDEYVAGTDAKNAQSNFHLNALIKQTEGIVLNWASATGKTYTLYRWTNIVERTMESVSSNIPATPPENTYTDAHTEGLNPGFYRIRVEP